MKNLIKKFKNVFKKSNGKSGKKTYRVTELYYSSSLDSLVEVKHCKTVGEIGSHSMRIMTSLNEGTLFYSSIAGLCWLHRFDYVYIGRIS